MTKTPTKAIARRLNSQNLLTQLVTDNRLIQEVQSLDASVVKQIIHHIGLEDSGELLMLITSEQMLEVMDQDTWASDKIGEDERLDAKRFCIWLEVLLEVGSDFAVDKIIEMDEELLMAVMSQLVFAMDAQELSLMARYVEDEYATNNQYLEKILDSTFTMETEGYIVMSRETFEWDTVSTLFTILEKNHRDLLERILSRVARTTLGYIEEFDGLFNLLTESEFLENDVSTGRQERREKEGFVSPSSASAFLKLIIQSTLEKIVQDPEQDHISKMYFRNFKPTKTPTRGFVSPDLMKLLNAHGIVESKALRLTTEKKASAIQNYLGDLRTANEKLFHQKITELNFLANVLVSGYSPTKQSLRVVEAMDLAIQTCDQGWEYIQAQGVSVPIEDLLRLFKLGWKLRPSQS